LGFPETDGLPKEARLFLATYGQAKKGSLAYVQAQQLFAELLSEAYKQFLPGIARPPNSNAGR
jgi:hypothetical protein